MIRPLRERHRIVATTLALVLPVGFVAAIAARRDAPRSETWQTGATIVDEPGPGAQWIPLSGSADFELHWKTGRASDGSGRLLALWPQQDPRRPQVLVYRTKQRQDSEQLPEDAVLLGALAGTEVRRFPIAEAAMAFDGRLLLYSLGHQEIIGRFDLPAAQGTTVVESED